jgi:hypothetical protein
VLGITLFAAAVHADEWMLPATQHLNGSPSQHIELAFELATGSAVPPDGRAWSEALSSAMQINADNHAWEAKHKAEFIAPLAGPQSDDESAWHSYLVEAFFRVDPDWKNGYPATTILRLPQHKDYQASVGFLHDAAAINLANAGSGHYKPAVEDGASVRGCGKFKIAFKLRGEAGLPVSDPRFPTIGARIAKLNDELTRRMQERINEFERPLSVGVAIVSGGPVAKRTIRQYARSCDSFIDETVGMAADFLDDIDYLEESPDIPESERRIFREEWPNNRSDLVVQFREMIGTIRDIVRVTDELGDYVAFSAPRRSSKGTDEEHTSAEDPQLNAIRERAKSALENLQNALKSRGTIPPTAPH